MRAAQFASYGPSDVLQVADRATPVPGPGQYLIKVFASSVNPIDWKLRSGALRFVLHPRLPSIPGFDVCGEVAQAGPGATRFALGSMVYSRIEARHGGASAEYALAAEEVVAPKPSNCSVEEAAAVPLAGLTALQALRDNGKLRAGQRVLVVGGAGGVGHFGVQIAKAMGAEVTASCSQGNLELVRSLGAKHVIDYRNETYRTFDGLYDIVLDTALANPFSVFEPLLAPSGRYVAATVNPPLFWHAPRLLLSSHKRISFVMLKSSGPDLEQLTTWIESGQLRAVVDRVYPLAELAQAHAYAEQGHVRGKVVIRVA